MEMFGVINWLKKHPDVTARIYLILDDISACGGPDGWRECLQRILDRRFEAMLATLITTAADVPALCDRTCYEHLVDSYLAALIAHDPSRLPLSPTVRYTEMGQPMSVGDGMWNSVSGRGAYSHYFVDQGAGQVGFYGTMKEGANGALMLMALRMRVQLGKITEIETTLYRKGGSGPAWNDAGVDNMEAQARPTAEWNRVVPPAQRLTRAQLIDTADSYFRGLQKNDGRGDYRFAPTCNRVENGVATTNNPARAAPNGGFSPMAMGCKEQFSTGYYAVVTRIHDRRYLIVDEERQVVLSYAVFDMNGTVHQITTPQGQVIPIGGFARPGSIHIAEAFQIEPGGLINKIEVIGVSAPYHFNPGWPGGAGGD